MRFLVFGDVVGKLGRKALISELPNLQADLKPDFTIVQSENLAHGKGITQRTIDEMRALNIDCFTGGNHTFSKPPGIPLLDDPDMIRPANYPDGTPGVGYRTFDVAGKTIIVLNLQGEMFMKETVDSPFAAVDAILNKPEHKDVRIRLIDFHAETTSERIAMGWHVDGSASLSWGTHTHVQTNDARILPQGTGYVTDIGMVGDRNGVLGVTREAILNNFLHPDNRRVHDFAEDGEAILSGIIADVDDETGHCTHIEPFNIFTTI